MRNYKNVALIGRVDCLVDNDMKSEIEIYTKLNVGDFIHLKSDGDIPVLCRVTKRVYESIHVFNAGEICLMVHYCDIVANTD